MHSFPDFQFSDPACFIHQSRQTLIRQRCGNWKDSEVDCLIELWDSPQFQQLYPQTQRPTIAYDYLARQLNRKMPETLNRTGAQIQTKIHNMMKQYRRLAQIPGFKDWKYYDVFDRRHRSVRFQSLLTSPDTSAL